MKYASEVFINTPSTATLKKATSTSMLPNSFLPEMMLNLRSFKAGDEHTNPELTL